MTNKIDRQYDKVIEKLPAQAGTYILLLRAFNTDSVVIGRLGGMKVQPGCYLYVGSAFGPGGLRARVRYHSQIHTKPHWHLDYLRPCLDLYEVWFCIDQTKHEVQWAELLAQCADTEIAMRGFGASDHRGQSHLFFVHQCNGEILFQQLLDAHHGAQLERVAME